MAYFPGRTSLKILQKIQKDLNLRILKIESSCCRCSMILIDEKRKSRSTYQNSEHVKNYAKKFSHVCWNFFRLGSEKKRLGDSGKVASHSQLDVGTVRGIWTSTIQKCFSAFPWNPQEEEGQGDHTLHSGCFRPRPRLSNDALSKSAQYLRSSRQLV